MVNGTRTTTIVLIEEGNYTCVATNKYGTDMGEVSVIFTGKNNYTMLLFLTQLCYAQQ